MNKLADTINELKLEITYLQKEGENKDQNLQQKEEQLEKTIQQHHEKILEMDNQSAKEKEAFNKKYEALQADLDEMRT